MIDEKGRFLTTITHKRGLDIRNGILEGHGEITNPAAMIRTDAFRAIGGCRADFIHAEDIDVWLRLDEIGGLDNIPIALTQYRIHPNSVSEKFGFAQRQSALKACQDAWKRRNIEGQFTATALWRAGNSRESQLEYMLKYGWLAWNSKQFSTATIYGAKAIKIKMLSKKAWQLFYCGIFKKHSSK